MDTEVNIDAPEARADEINVGDVVRARDIRGWGCDVVVTKIAPSTLDGRSPSSYDHVRVWAKGPSCVSSTHCGLSDCELVSKSYEDPMAQPNENGIVAVYNADGTPDEPDTEPDITVRPAHYTRWVIEPITFIMLNGFEMWRGNIVKYASRAGFKLYDGKDQTESEIGDLRKVIRYAEMRINQLNGEPVL